MYPEMSRSGREMAYLPISKRLLCWNWYVRDI